MDSAEQLFVIANVLWFIAGVICGAWLCALLDFAGDRHEERELQRGKRE